MTNLGLGKINHPIIILSGILAVLNLGNALPWKYTNRAQGYTKFKKKPQKKTLLVECLIWG
jgi:hypothetical protein